MKLSIVVIDDNEMHANAVKIYILQKGHDVVTANRGEKGLELIKQKQVDLVLCDFMMPVMNGLEVLQEIKKINSLISVVIMTAYGNIEHAVEIMKTGADDYITKPFKWIEIENILTRFIEKKKLIEENLYLKKQLQDRYKFGTVLTKNQIMESILDQVTNVANNNKLVIISGESGTGKELIARAIHGASSRNQKPFILVNTSSYSGKNLELDLFGYVKEAFSGATHDQIGAVEQADKGTLFINEIGELPQGIQKKLQQLVNYGFINRLGDKKEFKVDVQLICATQKKLTNKDILDQPGSVNFSLPPLRERKEDVPLLVEHFIKKFSVSSGKTLKGITSKALEMLMSHDFPGNISELENIIEQSVILCKSDQITVNDLVLPMKKKSGIIEIDPYDLSEGFDAKLFKLEKIMIEEALKRSNGNQSAAARLLKISERKIRFRLSKIR